HFIDGRYAVDLVQRPIGYGQPAVEVFAEDDVLVAAHQSVMSARTASLSVACPLSIASCTAATRAANQLANACRARVARAAAMSSFVYAGSVTPSDSRKSRSASSITLTCASPAAPCCQRVRISASVISTVARFGERN